MGPISEWFRRAANKGQSAKRPLKIHSAPVAHKPPKVGYACDRLSQITLPAARQRHATEPSIGPTECTSRCYANPLQYPPR